MAVGLNLMAWIAGLIFLFAGVILPFFVLVFSDANGMQYFRRRMRMRFNNEVPPEDESQASPPPPHIPLDVSHESSD